MQTEDVDQVGRRCVRVGQVWGCQGLAKRNKRNTTSFCAGICKGCSWRL